MKHLNKRQQTTALRILCSALLFLFAQPFHPYQPLSLLLSLAAYLLIGWDVLYRAAHNIFHGQVFDEHFLMSIATLGAIVLQKYDEAVFVMLFYQVGELFQSCAVDRSRRSIAELMALCPDMVHVERNGRIVQASPEEISTGETIVVQPGERIALDGVIISGSGTLDTAALTGESLPRSVQQGDEVLSGCINQSSVLHIRVSCEYEHSTVSRILDLVEHATTKKAHAEHFITRFARWYTPCVVIAAVLLAVVPSILWGNWSSWLERALIFLVVSCPCALVISVPLSFFGGIGGASRNGILVKGGNYLEALARTSTVVMDKTGTLTKGVFRVSQILPQQNISAQELLTLAALAECYSSHPIAVSLREACSEPLLHSRVQNVQELSGKGVRAVIDGKQLLVGKSDWLIECGISVPSSHSFGTAVHIACEQAYAGAIFISDTIKPEAAHALAQLKRAGVRSTVMLTGDSSQAAQAVASEIGIDHVFSELLPAEKVHHVEQLLTQKPAGSSLLFVGDGINDAPVLSRADVGIAMGGIGSDAAIEAADVVLMDDNLQKLPLAIQIARKTVRIVQQNIIFALGVKGLVLILGAWGLAGMWQAVFADIGVSVIAILNAMRALNTPRSASEIDCTGSS